MAAAQLKCSLKWSKELVQQSLPFDPLSNISDGSRLASAGEDCNNGAGAAAARAANCKRRRRHNGWILKNDKRAADKPLIAAPAPRAAAASRQCT